MVCGTTMERGLIMSGGPIIMSGHEIIISGAITIADYR